MKAALLAFLIPLVTSTPILNVDIHISDDTHGIKSPATVQHSEVLSQTPIKSSAQIPGWVFLEGDKLIARIHGNTFWTIRGKIEKPLPMDDFLFDPLIFNLNNPEDFEGKFGGVTARGQFSLTWERSGATITGRSPIGEFEINGTSTVAH